MNRPPYNLAAFGALGLAALLLGGAVPFPSDPTVESAFELFPAARGLNVQRGFAVATHGNWLAVGAPLDDTNGPKNAGAVLLFEWSEVKGSWRPAGKLHSDNPQTGARFGSALAMEGDSLAVAAIGEGHGEGKVYMYRRAGGAWGLEATLSESGAKRFGGALSIGEGRLAVGAAASDGVTPGAVYVFNEPAWTLEKMVVPQGPQQIGERFGAAVALQGGRLVVGAPGYSLAPDRSGAGAVYVFSQPGLWTQQALLTVPTAAAGSQLGFSVGISGDSVLAGAPAEASNAGALYVFRNAGSDDWSLVRLAAGSRAGDQLGAALAVRDDLLAVAAPFADRAAGKTGTIRVFHRQGGSWGEVGSVDPDNAERLDLVGLALAVSGNRIAAGAVLGDQGGGAAGAAWTFRCFLPGRCAEEAEAVASERKEDERFGTALAVDPAGDRVAVASARYERIDYTFYGSIGGGPSVVSAREGEGGPTGSVAVFRKAGLGWRQEALIPDPARRTSTAFGSAIALEGDTLVVGAPLDDASSGVPPTVPTTDSGLVYVYRRTTTSWTLQTTLQAPVPQRNESFGAAVALAGDLLAVGAPGSDSADGTRINSGAVYLFERSAAGDWLGPADIRAGDPRALDRFGTAVALHADTLAIGAPLADAAYVAERSTGWRPTRLAPASDGQVTSELGRSVSLADGWLVAGAPGAAGGAIDLFSGAGTAWTFYRPFDTRNVRGHRFGASVSLFGKCLVVGDFGHAYLYVRQAETWVFQSGFNAVRPRPGDEFGSSVGAGPGFFVVTNPGSAGGDRVTLFKLRDPELCSE